MMEGFRPSGILLLMALTALLLNLTLPSLAYHSEAVNDMNSSVQNIAKNVKATEEELLTRGDYGRADPSPMPVRSRTRAAPILHAKRGLLSNGLSPSINFPCSNRRGLRLSNGGPPSISSAFPFNLRGLLSNSVSPSIISAFPRNSLG